MARGCYREKPELGPGVAAGVFALCFRIDSGYNGCMGWPRGIGCWKGIVPRRLKEVRKRGVSDVHISHFHFGRGRGRIGMDASGQKGVG
jgi:hypothetical protein